MNDNNDIRKESDLLEFLKYILSCTYISDLIIEPYNTKARLLLKQLNLEKYPIYQIKDAFEYLYNNGKNK